MAGDGDAPRIIRPSPGMQETFLRTPAREAFAGGSAGPGKSFALLLGATRFVHERHYRAILFRRTFPELEKSLIEQSHEIYPHLGAKYQGDKHVWTFPTGAKIRFGHLEHEKDVFKYDGAEFQYCGFDELTQFTRKQYTFMFSRLRSSSGLPTYMRSTSNPGGIGDEWQWVITRFAAWIYPADNTEYKGPRARSGEVLYFTNNGRNGDMVVPKDYVHPKCVACSPPIACATHRARSRTYIQGKLSENPYLAGTEYEQNLEELDPVMKAWKKDGDWFARPAAGKYFQRANLPIIAVAPARVLARVRYWDRAATEGGGDWTVGVLMSVVEDGHFVVEDVVRAQLGPGGVEATIKATAQLDPPGTAIGLERDPAQAGKFEAAYYVSQLVGYNVIALPPEGDKITRASPVSAQAQATTKNIVLVQGAWNEAYIRELENFPEGTKDQVDATSGAFRLLFPVLVQHRQSGGKKPGGVSVRVI